MYYFFAYKSFWWLIHILGDYEFGCKLYLGISPRFHAVQVTREVSWKTAIVFTCLSVGCLCSLFITIYKYDGGFHDHKHTTRYSTIKTCK